MGERFLVMRARNHLCAFALFGIEETLRPLPLRALPDAPPAVVGATILRGVPTPVVDAGLLLGGERLNDPRRLVSIKAAPSRRVALLVDAVLGVSDVELGLTGAAPLLSSVEQSVIASLGKLDHELLTVLSLGRLLTNELWESLAKERA